MIRSVNKWYCDQRTHPKLPLSTFNIVDTTTNSFMEPDETGVAKYYLFHNRDINDIYKRVVDLNFVEVCETDLEDDLSIYGFELIGNIHYSTRILKRWVRK